jgi:hypothetical protein
MVVVAGIAAAWNDQASKLHTKQAWLSAGADGSTYISFTELLQLTAYHVVEISQCLQTRHLLTIKLLFIFPPAAKSLAVIECKRCL